MAAHILRVIKPVENRMVPLHAEGEHFHSPNHIHWDSLVVMAIATNGGKDESIHGPTFNSAL